MPAEIGLGVTVSPVNSAVPKMREVEGLRAIAILAVLMFHAHIGLQGGFVGVDVFFVLSGFLITTLLVAERDLTGRVSLWDFYARRARRLLPLAALVLGSTIAVAWFFLDEVTSKNLGKDATWASLLLANMRFAHIGTDYLTSTQAPSALQHWWSLAIEEQFYLLWPAALVVLWRRFSNRLKSAAWLALIITAASFAMCVFFTKNDPVRAFFSLPTRAWELAAGAFLAVTLRYVRISFRIYAPWVGLVLLAGTFVFLPKSASFPGPFALLPVVATLCVLCSVNLGTKVSAGLSHPALQWVGARSYALYLWHWPLLVIAENRFGPLSLIERLAALAATFVLTEISHRIIETPIRRARVLAKRPRLSVSLGAALIIAAASGGVALAQHESDVKTGYIATTSTTTPAPTTTAVQATTTTQSTNPTTTTTTLAPRHWENLLEEYVSSTARPQLLQDLTQNLVPENLSPTLSKASKDVPAPFINGCLATGNATSNPACFAGNPSLPVEITFFGDSKAAQWFPGMWKAARRANWRVSVLTKASCPAATIHIKTASGGEYTSCDNWRTKAIERINASNTTIVVISSNWYAASYGNKSWATALAETVRAFTSAGKRVVILSNTPVWKINPATCAASHMTSLQQCSKPVAEVTNLDRNSTESNVAAAYGATFVNVNKWLCTTSCPIVSGSTLMYMDPYHISSTMSKELSVPLEYVIRAALEAPAPKQR
jgi:peptidoglycan/LPS O-acetylase OafA/YrhL